MRFLDIEGHQKVKDELIQSVKKNRVSHSHLFEGTKGTAKLALAISFAQYINCTQRKENDSCGECDSCVKNTTLSHPDLHLVFPVLSIYKNKKSVSDQFLSQWRKSVLENPYLSLSDWFDVFNSENKSGKTGRIYSEEVINIHNKLKLKGYESKNRIIIIWMPENMQQITSNKLLKMLEEPPKNTFYLLVSEKPEQLLKTVLSRLQITRVREFKKQEIKQYISKKFQISSEKQELIINRAGKDLGKITRILNNNSDGEKMINSFQEWMRICYTINIKKLSDWTTDRSRMGRKDNIRFLEYSLDMIRNSFIINYANDININVNQNENDFLKKFHQFINEENVIKISQKIEESIRHLNRNANLKIILFEMSLQISKFLKVNRKFVV